MRTHVGFMVAGGLLGAVVGAIAAVNVVIWSGTDRGYETSLPELFDGNVALGMIVVAILVAGPAVGAIVGHRSWLAHNHIHDPEDAQR